MVSYLLVSCVFAFLDVWLHQQSSAIPTFILGRVDALVEAPVLTAAGHLHNVELTHASFTLGVKSIKTRLEH